MPLIRPISDLRNRALEISELCHAEEQPIFITRNGKGDLVVMSQAHYERLQSLIELYQKYGELITSAPELADYLQPAAQEMVRG